MRTDKEYLKAITPWPLKNERLRIYQKKIKMERYTQAQDQNDLDERILLGFFYIIILSINSLHCLILNGPNLSVTVFRN